MEDSDTDPDEIAHDITRAYHEHVEAYLATTYPPVDVEQAVASGLLGSPLLGTSTRVTADWCHAWSVLGQWSGLVTFLVPASGVWPRHGHLRMLSLGNWIVHGLCKGPHLLSFVAFFTDGFACISIQFPASRSLCNDLAKALEALDGKNAMVIYGESLMATKVDNPTSTNGLGLS